MQWEKKNKDVLPLTVIVFLLFQINIHIFFNAPFHFKEKNF